MNNGQLIAEKSMTALQRGLFSPYIYKDINDNGFWLAVT
jgi:hypothetical protein